MKNLKVTGLKKLCATMAVMTLSFSMLTACGSNEAEATEEEAVATEETTADTAEATTEETADANLPQLTTDIDNVHAKITLSFTKDDQSFSTVYDGVIDEVNQKQHFTMTTSVMGVTVSGDVYTDMNTDTCYVSMAGSEFSVSDGSSTYVNYKATIDRLNSGEDVECVSEGEYKIKLTDQELVVMNDEPIDEADYSDEYEATVYVSDGYITEIDYTLSNLDENLQDYQVTVELSDYNNAGTVEFPF